MTEDYAKYVSAIKEQYQFPFASYNLDLNGFHLELRLDQSQIITFKRKANDLRGYKLKAEMFAARKLNAPLAMVREIELNCSSDTLYLTGSPDAIEAFIYQIFSI